MTTADLPMKRPTITLTTIAFALAVSACVPNRKVREKPAPGSQATDPGTPGGPTLSPDDPAKPKDPDNVDGPDTAKPKNNPVPVPAPKDAPKNPEYAIKIDGKPGYVKSPYDGAGRMIDVRGLPPGTEAECPYTHRTFLVPP